MTDHKFTDEKVKNALERLREMAEYTPPICHYEKGITEPPFCKPYEQFQNDAKVALALINRQKASLQEVITLNSKLEAENAKLQRLLDFYEKTSGNKKAKTEAIKEFAWRLKNRLTPYPEAPFCEMVGSLDIDALVKEMTEELK